MWWFDFEGNLIWKLLEGYFCEDIYAIKGISNKIFFCDIIPRNIPQYTPFKILLIYLDFKLFLKNKNRFSSSIKKLPLDKILTLLKITPKLCYT